MPQYCVINHFEKSKSVGVEEEENTLCIQTTVPWKCNYMFTVILFWTKIKASLQISRPDPWRKPLKWDQEDDGWLQQFVYVAQGVVQNPYKSVKDGKTVI